MTDTLPPFTGDPSRCAKCAHDVARTLYRQKLGPSELIAHELRGVEVADREQERLCRECTRCGFHWDEAVVVVEEPVVRPVPGALTERGEARCLSQWNTGDRVVQCFRPVHPTKEWHHDEPVALLGGVVKQPTYQWPTGEQL